MIQKGRNISKLLIYVLVAITACSVMFTQIKALDVKEVQPQAAVWEESRSARVANYNRSVQIDATAEVSSTGSVQIKSVQRSQFAYVKVTPWIMQKYGRSCFGYAFNVYDDLEIYDMISAYLGVCFGSSENCPTGFNYWNCSCH